MANSLDTRSWSICLGFRENTGADRISLSIEKIPYGVVRSETRPGAVAHGPFTCSEAHMGRVLGEPSAGPRILGKIGKKLFINYLQIKMLNGLTSRKFGALRPWSRRSTPKDPYGVGVSPVRIKERRSSSQHKAFSSVSGQWVSAYSKHFSFIGHFSQSMLNSPFAERTA